MTVTRRAVLTFAALTPLRKVWQARTRTYSTTYSNLY